MEEISYTDLVKSLREFLTVLFHNLLHHRLLYPDETFDVVTRYNIALYQNRHPGVRSHITQLVGQIIHHVHEGSVSRVSFVVLSSQDLPLERYVIDLAQFPDVSPIEQDYIIDDLGFSWNDLQQQYRALLVHLATIAPDLGKLPINCSFTVMIETRYNDPTLWDYDSPWTLAPKQNMKVKKGTDNHSYEMPPEVWAVKSRPIRRVEAGLFSFNVWFEEGRSKGKLKDI